jgi:hypothetical protein
MSMGIDEDQRFPGTPRTIYLSSDVREGELHVFLGYEDPFR